MIKNIVLDIGNVILKWDPIIAIKQVFPDINHIELLQNLIKENIWIELNLGHITEEEAITQYSKLLQIPEAKMRELIQMIKENLVPIEGSFELIDELYQTGFDLYSITDNIIEFMQYIKSRYDFWKKFKDIIVSAEVGILKPSPEIFKILLHRNSLIPEETVFIDDLQKNVEGAISVGMHGVHFTSTLECKRALHSLMN